MPGDRVDEFLALIAVSALRREVEGDLVRGLPGSVTSASSPPLMQPAFHRQSLPLIADNIIDFTAERLRKWESQLDADGGVDIYDIAKDVGDLALRIVVRSLFSVDTGESLS